MNETAVPDNVIPKRRTLWLKVVVVLLLTLAATVIPFQLMIASRWNSFLAEQKTLMGRFEARSGVRVPLEGQALAGRCWDDLEPAMSAISIELKSWQGRKVRPLEAIRVMNGGGDQKAKASSEETARSFITSIKVRLDQARQGTRRADASYRSHGPDPAEERNLHRRFFSDLHPLLVFTCREARDRGDVAEAVSQLAALLQFGLDRAHPTSELADSMSAGAYLSIAMNECSELISQAEVKRDDLARLGVILKRLDEQWPSCADILETKRVLLGELLRQKAESGGWMAGPMDGARLILGEELGMRDMDPVDSWRMWRQLYSPKLIIAQHMAHYDYVVAVIREGEGKSWADAAELYSQALSQIDQAGNEISDWTAALWFDEEPILRRDRAQLRMLRGAVAIRLGLDPAGEGWPVNPFDGKPVMLKEEGERAVVECRPSEFKTFMPKRFSVGMCSGVFGGPGKDKYIIKVPRGR